MTTARPTSLDPTTSPYPTGLPIDKADGVAMEIRRDDFDIAVHNVVVTITNPKTGGHKTFKISTVQNDKNVGTRSRPFVLAAGTRTVSILSGPNNDPSRGDWERFGFLGKTGAVYVFKNRRGTEAVPSDWEKFAAMLENPKRYPRLLYQLMAYCRRCNRPLTAPESLSSGLGPVCGGRS